MATNQVQRAAEMRKAIQMWAATLVDNEDAMIAIPSIFPEWKIGASYAIKDVFSYGVNSVGDIQLYQVLQAHTATAEWTPDTATSLYKAIGIDASGIPKWVQPLGATDAYMKGDIVTHNDKTWTSDIDNNVWEPGVYGWTEKADDTDSGDSGDSEPVEPTEPENPDTGDTDTPTTDDTEDDIPDFVQPTDATNAYVKGAKVKFNGKIYESLIDNNVYSPTDYPAGWKEVDG